MPTRPRIFREWPKYATYDAKEIETLCRPDSADYPHIAIYYYIQFNLHRQLLAATEHARANGVVLKGDIPIGISRNSVEAWKEVPLLQPERTSRCTA